jgi:vancomycin resistance protein VanJ
VIGACILLLLPIVAPIESGPIAVALLLSPHLALASIVQLPVALVVRSRRLAVGVAVVALLFGYRFGSDWWSSPVASDDGAPTVDVATWNVEAGAQAELDIVALLNRHPVDLIAIEELTATVAAAIEADPQLAARYPFRALFPSPGVAGIGLLSQHRIVSASNDLHPVRIEAQIDIDGRDLFVLAAHPFPAVITRLSGVPSGFDPSDRNTELELLRQRALELDVLHDRVLLLGDFNTAPTEPAFRRLTNGLHDVHADVGVGPGWTWRPARFAFLGIGLLRIDLILSSSSLLPVRTSIDCPNVGDHCLLAGSFQFVD